MRYSVFGRASVIFYLVQAKIIRSWGLEQASGLLFVASLRLLAKEEAASVYGRSKVLSSATNKEGVRRQEVGRHKQYIYSLDLFHPSLSPKSSR